MQRLDNKMPIQCFCDKCLRDYTTEMNKRKHEKFDKKEELSEEQKLPLLIYTVKNLEEIEKLRKEAKPLMCIFENEYISVSGELSTVR